MFAGQTFAGMSHAAAERRGWKERRDRKMAILFSSRRGYRPSGTKSFKSTSNDAKGGKPPCSNSGTSFLISSDFCSCVAFREREKGKKKKKKKKSGLTRHVLRSLHRSGSIRLAREESVARPGDESCPLCSVVTRVDLCGQRGQPADNSEERCQ